jgi:large conductance mechanosensitive channel
LATKTKGEINMKKFFAEFKKFITRGNVVDMAVGVIVGSSFTAIVNALSNNILKPVINYLLALIFGANSLSEVYTFLQRGYKDVLDEAGNVIGQELDLAQSIYIDWGTFINAIINFLLIAFVLFTIVKIFNSVRDGQKQWVDGLDDRIPSKEERKEMKKRGIKMSDKAAVAAFYAEKAAAEAAAKAEAEEKARQERLANPTTEDLLKDILKLLKNSDIGS